jgi:hypothetical protein
MPLQIIAGAHRGRENPGNKKGGPLAHLYFSIPRHSAQDYLLLEFI